MQQALADRPQIFGHEVTGEEAQEGDEEDYHDGSGHIPEQLEFWIGEDLSREKEENLRFEAASNLEDEPVENEKRNA